MTEATQKTDERKGRREGSGRSDRGGRPPRGRRPEEPKEFDQRILDLARVTRVTAGGKRMRFRACVIIGDGKGRVAQGTAKGQDVTDSVNKAVRQGKKRLVTVPIVNGTIPHSVFMKFGAAKVLLNPAPMGTGVKAGGAVRVVLELAGVPNATAKMLGGKNKLNNAKATLLALAKLKKRRAKDVAVTAAAAE
jgi:small subunit ribosomal protein S5